MTNPSNPNQPPQNAPAQAGINQGGQTSSPILAILQLAQGLAKPLQMVFKLRHTTQLAKHRVKELQDRVKRLESEIQAASGKDNSGSRLDRFR